MSGWIKIYREISQHWIFQDAEKFKWWIDLLLMASHEDCRVMVKGELTPLKRGQLTVSLSFLSARWGRSKEKVLNFLRLLESDHMIERNSDRKSTTITICNYDSYQEVSEQTPTANRPQTRPLSDQSPTEYKNVEEYILSSTTNAHAHTCEEVSEREAGFAERFREEGLWYETAKVAGIDPHSIFDVFESFCFEHKYTQHADYADFRRHFISYCRKKVEIGKDSNSAPASGKQSAWDYNSQLAAELGIIN